MEMIMYLLKVLTSTLMITLTLVQLLGTADPTWAPIEHNQRESI